MIDPKCKGCGKELDEFGALLLSPPLPKEIGKVYPDGATDVHVRKDHLCVDCYELVLKTLALNRASDEARKLHNMSRSVY